MSLRTKLNYQPARIGWRMHLNGKSYNSMVRSAHDRYYVIGSFRMALDTSAGSNVRRDILWKIWDHRNALKRIRELHQGDSANKVIYWRFCSLPSLCAPAIVTTSNTTCRANSGPCRRETRFVSIGELKHS